MTWIALLAPPTVFTVMFALGLLLTADRIRQALDRSVLLAALVFSAVVPLPILVVGGLLLAHVTGPVAVGVVLMAISPGAPVALRRAIEAGSPSFFAPVLHLAIVLTAVVSVPGCVWLLDRLLDADFRVTPLHIGRQVLVAQLLPLALGAALRAARPAFALRIEPVVARISNYLLLLLAVVCLLVLGPAINALHWVPTMLGVVFTLGALVIGRAFAGWHSPFWPAGAVATAMRNPGLALVVASVNRAPESVTAAIFGYALGLAVVMAVFVARRRNDAGPQTG